MTALRRFFKTVRLAALLACVAGASRAAHAAETAPTAVPLERQPYRVRIELAFDVRPEFDARFQRSVVRELAAALDRAAGAMWRVEIETDRASRSAGRSALERLDPRLIAATYATSALDKLYLLSIEGAGGGYRLCGREWDELTAQPGPVLEVVFPQRREIAAQAALLVRELFRPVAAIEPARKGPAVLRARGGDLAPHDETWQPLREGRVFEVFNRHLGKDRALERIQQVPWSYLTAGAPAEGTAEATVASGLRSPLAGRRRKVESVALAVSRSEPTTRLTMVTRPPNRRPLGGIEVELTASPRPDDQAKQGVSPPRRLVTDRNGTVTLTPADAPPDGPVWLFVKSGQNLLARVPFIPGIRPREELELPDDAPRLEVEGRVAQLQSELVDTVARRAVLAARVRSRAKVRVWEEVDALMKQIAGMRGASAFTTDLNAIRIPALAAARARKDRSTEQRVLRLCDETAELIRDYLDDDKLRELREEVDELKQVAAQDAAAEAQFQSDQKPGTGGANSSVPSSAADSGVQRARPAAPAQKPVKLPAF